MEEIKAYVEFGPNLKNVLLAMVNKVYTADSSGQYYSEAYEQITKAIVGAIKATMLKKEEGEDGR